MTSIEVNGKSIKIRPTKSKFERSAFQISQEIYQAFERIGITRDFITLELPRNPLKNDLPAEIAWVVNGKDHYYSCDTQETYRDNLGVISKVIIQDAYAIRNGMKSLGQVMNQFRIGYDPESPNIKTPRQILGLSESMNDFEYIKYKYKQKAKEMHPDTGGDPNQFNELNEAYNALKKEFGED